MPEFIPDTKEMDALRSKLQKMGVEYVVSDDESGLHTLFIYGETRVSVICKSFSYGGKDGLLECFCFNDRKDPLGYLTADEVLDYVKQVEGSK